MRKSELTASGRALSPLGEVSPDPISIAIGSNFVRFRAPNGLRGLVRCVADGVEILAVDANPPGNGQFREFIRQCKDRYRSILILEIMNPWLPEVLARYGFVEWSGDGGEELLQGMIWTSPQAIKTS